jgi:predicted GIY-YIG superfamily endonuclease
VILAVVLMTLAAALVLAVVVQAVRSGPGRALPPPVPVRRPVRTEVPHLLYCYEWSPRFGTGRIYYGISNEPENRHARHLTDPNDQWWMRLSTGVMIPLCRYPNRDVARAAERRAVRAGAYAGEDLANDQHHPLKVRQPRALR